MAKIEPQYLFVYGTLLRELASPMHSLLTSFAEYVGETEIQGQLYEVDQYPGLILSKNSEDKVQVEVYRLKNPDTVIQRLDDYEGCSPLFPEPHEFRRIKTKVLLKKNQTVSGWVYIFNLSIQGLVRIESGNYAEFVRQELENNLHTKQDV